MSQSVINLDAGISYSVYSMIEIMKGQRPDGNLIYEIHEDLGPGEPDPEFKRRTSSYYMAFAMLSWWISGRLIRSAIP